MHKRAFKYFLVYNKSYFLLSIYITFLLRISLTHFFFNADKPVLYCIKAGRIIFYGAKIKNKITTEYGPGK